MEKKFNQSLFFNNIYFLVKKNSKKIGELESEVGVSPGYISRTSKESNIKPSIDFVMNIARSLNISLDAILNINFNELTSTEIYLLKFFQKLSEDTINGKLDWKRETIKDLNNIPLDVNGNPEHPCFSIVNFGNDDKTEKNHNNKSIFISKSFGINTSINGDGFNLRLKNSAYIYIFDISKHKYENNDKFIFAKEVWIIPPAGSREFLYSTCDNAKLSSILENLYSNIVEDSKHPKVNSDVRYIIDAFMKNDMEDSKINF